MEESFCDNPELHPIINVIEKGFMQPSWEVYNGECTKDVCHSVTDGLKAFYFGLVNPAFHFVGFFIYNLDLTVTARDYPIPNGIFWPKTAKYTHIMHTVNAIPNLVSEGVSLSYKCHPD